jgi:hypothetical protein
MIPNDLLGQFCSICDEMKAHGVNVVAVLASYGKDDAHFSTLLRVTNQPDAGVTEDHIVLDAQREIMAEWHKATHPGDDCGGCPARRGPGSPPSSVEVDRARPEAVTTVRPLAIAGANGRGRRLLWL